MRRASWLLFACLFCSLLTVGCLGSDEGVKFKGVIQVNGRPYHFAPNEELQVSFLPIDTSQAHARIAAATIDKSNSTFQVNGPTNEGLPPGMYKITIASLILGKNGTGDRFRGAFDAQHTPLTCNITEDEGQSFVIDVARRSVTKQ